MANQLSPHAGKTLDPPLLLNVPRLVTAYFTGKPEPAIPSQRVAFGTSGHRGSAFDNAFNEAHIPGDQSGHLPAPKPRAALPGRCSSAYLRQIQQDAQDAITSLFKLAKRA